MVAVSDAAVHVLHRDSVRELERRLGGADPDAGPIVAVIAQDEEWHVLQQLHVLSPHVFPGFHTFLLRILLFAHLNLGRDRLRFRLTFTLPML